MTEINPEATANLWSPEHVREFPDVASSTIRALCEALETASRVIDQGTDEILHHEARASEAEQEVQRLTDLGVAAHAALVDATDGDMTYTTVVGGIEVLGRKLEAANAEIATLQKQVRLIASSGSLAANRERAEKAESIAADYRAALQMIAGDPLMSGDQLHYEIARDVIAKHQGGEA